MGSWFFKIMKNLLFLLLLSGFTIKSSYSQIWEHSYGIVGEYDDLQNLNMSYDGGYLILGGRFYYPNTRGIVYKTDVNGNLLYEIRLGTGTGMPQGSYPSFIESTSDGGMIICGSHENWTPNDIGITKLDACGNLQWCKTFRTDNNYDWGRVVHQLPDGGYVMLTHQYLDAWHTKVHLFRFNTNGDLLWIQPYLPMGSTPQPLYSDGMTDLIVTSTEDFFMTGKGYWAPDSLIGYIKAVTIIADSTREEKSISVFEKENLNNYSMAYNSIQNGSGNIYVGSLYVVPGYTPMMIVMDTLGNFISDTLIQFPKYINRWADGYIIDPTFTTDNRMFAYTVYMDSTLIFDSSPIGVHEIDSTGGWHNTFVLDSTHSYARMIITNDDKILVAGCLGYDYGQQIIISKLNTSLQYDSIYTVPRVYDYLCPDTIVSKTISLDCEVIVDVKDIPSPQEYYRSIKLIPITPAPNPARDEVRFMLKNTEHHRNIRVVCYDIFGREMGEVPVNAGTDEARMDVSNWTPGMYMAVVYSGNKRVGSARFIVQR